MKPQDTIDVQGNSNEQAEQRSQGVKDLRMSINGQAIPDMQDEYFSVEDTVHHKFKKANAEMKRVKRNINALTSKEAQDAFRDLINFNKKHGV